MESYDLFVCPVIPRVLERISKQEYRVILIGFYNIVQLSINYMRYFTGNVVDSCTKEPPISEKNNKKIYIYTYNVDNLSNRDNSRHG